MRALPEDQLTTLWTVRGAPHLYRRGDLPQVAAAVAATMRSVVARPTAKGEVSVAVTALLDEPYLRHCRPCGTTHLYEMPFRWRRCGRGWSCKPGRLAVEASMVRLLGPFDLFLQARDRDLLVADAARANELWRPLGRPGAVLAGGEIAGTWRPRKTGTRLRLEVQAWAPVTDLLRAAVTEQAEKLAAFRGLRLDGQVTT